MNQDLNKRFKQIIRHVAKGFSFDHEKTPTTGRMKTTIPPNNLANVELFR